MDNNHHKCTHGEKTLIGHVDGVTVERCDLCGSLLLLVADPGNDRVVVTKYQQNEVK